MPDTLPEPLGFLIADVARLLRRRYEESLAAAGLGLTPGEARALAFASHLGPLRQAQLAERMNVEPMTLVGFLDRLEARGLIARVVDPTDRRAKRVVVQDEARDIVARIQEIGRQTRESATSGLGEAETEALRHALIAVRDTLVAARGDEAGGNRAG